MVEGLLLDGIHAEAAGATVGGQHHPVVLTPPDEAQAALAFVQLAEARTQIALHPTVIEEMPVVRGGSLEMLAFGQ